MTLHDSALAAALGNRPRLWTALLCLLLFAGSFWLYTGNNGFPLRYHPDEPGKVWQIRNDDYNFKHPQLMLSATQLLLAAKGLEGEQASKGQVVQAGREVSAFFGALAVVALTLMAFRVGGVEAAFVAGPLLMLCHALLVYAHFMKEDATLTGAFALWLLAAGVFLQAPGRRARAVLLGLCCGLFVSGKYIGVAGIPVSLGLALFLPAAGRWRANLRQAGLVLACCLAGYLLANFQILLDPAGFWEGVSYESKHAFTAHYGSYLEVPNWYGVRGLWDEIALVIWLPAAFYAWRVLSQWPRRSAQERLMLLAPLVVLVPLVLSRLYSTRYILPPTVAVFWLAGMGIWELLVRPPRVSLPRRLPWLTWRRAGLALFVAALGWQVFMSGKLLYLFDHDARTDLERFVAHELPEGALVLQDKYAALPDEPGEKQVAAFSQQVLTERFAGSVGSLEAAREKGVTHVAVCDRSYRRFFAERTVLSDYEEEYRAMRDFYQELFTQGRHLWQCKRRPGFPYLNIELRLYAITPLQKGETPPNTSYCVWDVSERD